MKKFLKHKKAVILIVVAFLAILFFGIIRANQTVQKREITRVTQGTLEQKMTISGAIDADEKATLRFQTSGNLAWVGVKEGDYVKKYQGIAALDSREVKKNLEKDLKDYLTTRWNFEQQRDDYNITTQSPNDAGHITVAQRRIMEKAQFTLDKSVLDVEIQNLAVEFSNLWTPIEGIITRVQSPYAGVNIIPAQAEFDVVNPKTVYFAATADQTDVVKLYQNLTGELTLDAYPDATISGIIKNISFTPKTGETSTVYGVKFVFNEDNTNYKYRVGMAGDLAFVTEKKENVLYVPNKFVKTSSGKKYLTVLRDGKEKKVNVITGMETDTDTQITSGVYAGETVYD